MYLITLFRFCFGKLARSRRTKSVKPCRVTGISGKQLYGESRRFAVVLDRKIITLNCQIIIWQKKNNISVAVTISANFGEDCLDDNQVADVNLGKLKVPILCRVLPHYRHPLSLWCFDPITLDGVGRLLISLQKIAEKLIARM